MTTTISFGFSGQVINANRLADLEPLVTTTLSARMRRDEKMLLAKFIAKFLADEGRLFLDTVSGEPFLMDEECRILHLGDKQTLPCRAYLRSAGINATESVYQFVIEELRTAAGGFPTTLQRRVVCQGGRLYIPCGPGAMVRASVGKLEKISNGSDGVYFAGSGIAEWTPLPLDDAINPLDVQAMKVALDVPDVATTYTPAVQRVLLNSWLTAFMSGAASMPILATLGAKGGGKSMLIRAILKLILGLQADLTTVSADKRDYDTLVTNLTLVGLDNVDSLVDGASWLFDSLAVTATGGTNMRRQFHTLSELATLPIIASVMLSSRTAVFARPDVAERTLPLFTRAFDNAERISESALLAELEPTRDAVLSWLAYTAAAVSEHKQHAPHGLPARFQDFAQTVWAYCQLSQDNAVDILNAWATAQAVSVGDADPLMRAIYEHLPVGPGWVDRTASEIIVLLQAADPDLPHLGGAKIVAGRLPELKAQLAMLGIRLTARRSQGRAKFTLQRS